MHLGPGARRDSREGLESVSALKLGQEARKALENGTLEREHFAASSDMLDPRNEVTDGWEDGAGGCQSPCLCKETCRDAEESSSGSKYTLDDCSLSCCCLVGAALMDSRSLVLGVGQELDTIWTVSIVGGTREGDEQRPYILLSLPITVCWHPVPYDIPVVTIPVPLHPYPTPEEQAVGQEGTTSFSGVHERTLRSVALSTHSS